MRNSYTSGITVGPGSADASGYLGYADTFSAFQDMAAAHAELIGVGFADMAKKGMFWLTVKTQVVFKKRPPIMSAAPITTWPEAPGRMRGCRSYVLEYEGEPVIFGKTEWAVIDVATKKLVPMQEVYPEGLEYHDETACEEPFARINDDFTGVEPYARYKVRSVDIDVGGHMNNAAYVRAVMGSLTTKEIEALNISRIDVIFRTSCFEGDELVMQKIPNENGLSIRVSKDDETVLLVAIFSK